MAHLIVLAASCAEAEKDKQWNMKIKRKHSIHET